MPLKSFIVRTIRYLTSSRQANNVLPFGSAAITEQEADYADFAFQIGNALINWSLVETELVILVSRITKTDLEQTGTILYYNMNASSWINMITDLLALDDRFHETRVCWNGLVSEIRSLKDVRDRLAHHTSSISDPYLVPPLLDGRSKSRTHKNKPLTKEQIKKFRQSILLIVPKIRTLSDTLSV